MEFLGILILIGLLVIIFLLLRPKQSDQALNLIQQQQQQVQQLLQQQQQHTQQLVQQQIDGLREHMRASLEGNTQQINQRLESTAQLMGNVRTQLGQVEEAHKRVYELAKDISSLQEILRAPKLRGNLGELFLKDLLSQILPPEHFSLPYTFKSGERVDAVINLGNGLVPVDAKFPLENFRRLTQCQAPEEKQPARKKFMADVKKHIDAIAKKYILPDEGTYDFALMYIPAENVYYETIIRDEGDKSIIGYALERRVIPVSPNTFYAYLQAILLGLKGMKVERHVQDIIRSLSRLRDDFSRFQTDFSKIGTHLNHARGSYEASEKRLGKLEEKLEGLDTITPASISAESPPRLTK
jgi:DNA recombination protein RmuC